MIIKKALVQKHIEETGDIIYSHLRNVLMASPRVVQRCGDSITTDASIRINNNRSRGNLPRKHLDITEILLKEE